MTITVNLDLEIIPVAVHSHGSLVIHCGMVLDVEDRKVLVAIVLDCPGSTKIYQPTLLLLSMCVSALIRVVTKTLVLNNWCSTSNENINCVKVKYNDHAIHKHQTISLLLYTPSNLWGACLSALCHSPLCLSLACCLLSIQYFATSRTGQSSIAQSMPHIL